MKRVINIPTKRINPSLSRAAFSGIRSQSSLTNQVAIRLFSSSLTRFDSNAEMKFVSEESKPKKISSDELLSLFENVSNGIKDTDYHLIDVREENERRAGMIPSSIWMKLGDVEASLLLNEDDFATEFKFGKFKKDDLLIFYCHSGKRSDLAQKMAIRAGYTNTRNYAGSWNEFSKQYPELIAFDPKLQ